MNIRYNKTARCFEAEFSPDFNGDLAAVKAAKFQYNGSVWQADFKKVARLREKKPASGLTITPEALEIYKPWSEQNAKNEEVKKQFQQVKKTLKKEESLSSWLPQGKEYLGREDLTPAIYNLEAHVSIPTPTERCTSCQDPIYFYEYADLCLTCSKELDSLFENS